MEAIENCRTEALGGQVYHCTPCDQFRYSYHSCQNRHCPKFFRAQLRRQLEPLKASLSATPALEDPLPNPAQNPDTPDQLEPTLKTLLCPRCGRPMQRLADLPPQKLSFSISPPIRPP